MLETASLDVPLEQQPREDFSVNVKGGPTSRFLPRATQQTSCYLELTRFNFVRPPFTDARWTRASIIFNDFEITNEMKTTCNLPKVKNTTFDHATKVLEKRGPRRTTNLKIETESTFFFSSIMLFSEVYPHQLVIMATRNDLTPRF